MDVGKIEQLSENMCKSDYTQDKLMEDLNKIGVTERSKLSACARKFHIMMIDKLIQKQLVGYTGWDDEKEKEDLKTAVQVRLAEATTKEDYVDAANFVMFLWHLSKEKE